MSDSYLPDNEPRDILSSLEELAARKLSHAPTFRKAAAEILRLHAEIEELRKDAAAAWALCASISAENEKLRAKLMAATGELCDRAAAAALKETGDE